MVITTRSIILGIVRDYSGETGVSRGELYREARARGYQGTQEELESRANSLAREGAIRSQPKGRMQYARYCAVQHPTKSIPIQTAKAVSRSQERETYKSRLGILLSEAERRVKESPGTPSRLLKHPYLRARSKELFGNIQSYVRPR